MGITFDNTHVLLGQVGLKIGDVIEHQRKIEWFVIAVNHSGATIAKLIQPSATMRISNTVEKGSVLRNLGEQIMNDFFAEKAALSKNKKTSSEESEKEMPTKAKVAKKRARGGLAADALNAAENGNGNGEPKAKRGRAPKNGAVAPKSTKGASEFIKGLYEAGEDFKDLVTKCQEKWGMGFTEESIKGRFEVQKGLVDRRREKEEEAQKVKAKKDAKE